MTDEPRDDLERALAEEPLAREVFGRLSEAQRKEYRQWIDQAESPEARERRIEETIERLVEGGRL